MKRERGVTLLELLVAVTLLSLLSVGMLFAMRVGLNAMGKTNERFSENRKSLSVERIVTAQLAGFYPAKMLCGPASQAPLFQGDPRTMRFVSTYSLQEGLRGYPRLLEYQVIPGENGVGVRLVVNEMLYAGAPSTVGLCMALTPMPVFRPVQVGPASFVLADKLASCSFLYKEEKPPMEPDLWTPNWIADSTPAAVAIQLQPLEADPARIQVPPIVAPLRVTRHAMDAFTDYEQPPSRRR